MNPATNFSLLPARPLSRQERVSGALAGAAIGDALAMPAHWYYDRQALRRDYGVIDRYLVPREPHPDSILWRSRYEPSGPRGEILHDQADWWGKRGIHYHRSLRAGENTLTWKLAREAWLSLEGRGGYDAEDYLERYLRALTTPGWHGDTYLEECHREFFLRYARGIPARRCAAAGKHAGGLAGLVPVVAWHAGDAGTAVARAAEHVALTHAGPDMAGAVDLLGRLLWRTLAGEPLREGILALQRGQASPFARHPFEKWLGEADDKVVGSRLSPACYLQDSVPSILYLALKYSARPAEGLVANTMLGGDNVHRGIILGALLGAENGLDAWPRPWREGLRDPWPLEAAGAAQ